LRREEVASTTAEGFMKLFKDSTGWEAARRSVRHTATVLAASQVHAGAAKGVKALLERWAQIEAERREAEDGVVDANALVAWIDRQVLDPAVQELASLLLHEAKQNRKDATFKKYFAEAPGEVIRLGLESEIERTKKFFHVADEVTPSKAVKAVLAKLHAAHAKGSAALQARKDATDAVARVALKCQTWREDANAARRSVETELDAYANEHKLDRDYANTFFPDPPSSKKKPAAPAPATPAGVAG
jgi:hypothetical protein